MTSKDTDKQSEEISGFDQLNVLFGKKDHCIDCTGDGHCSCGEKDK